MKKNIFLNNFSKKYLKLQKKAKQNIKVVSGLKLWVVVLIMFLVSGVYAYLVNVSSTRWYDLRKKEEKLARVETQHSIVDIRLLQQKRRVWDDLNEVLKDNYIAMEDHWISGIIRLEVSESNYKQIGFLQN